MWYPQAIYSKFLLKQPNILFGENAIAGLKTYPSTKLAVIHGSGLTTELAEIVKKASSAFEIRFIKKSWKDEPTVKEMSSNISELEEFKPDSILAIGGGSVIDGAKLLRCLYEFPFFDVKSNNFTMLNWSTKFFAIPTTMGSGAELSSASVLFNEETQTKEFVITHNFIPELVIFDDRFLVGAPKKTLYLSTIDAISHIVEGYVSNIENELINIYAEKALMLIKNNIDGIESLDSNKLLNLQMAAYFAGMVQNHCIVGATHAIAHKLANYGYSHALAISLVLTSVIEKNSKDSEVDNNYSQLAQNAAVGSSALDIIKLIDTIKSKVDLTKEKEKLAKDRDLILESEQFFEDALSDKGGMGNPIKMDKEFLVEIIQSIKL
jgi:alcohol dehydrogenase class IV